MQGMETKAHRMAQGKAPARPPLKGYARKLEPGMLSGVAGVLSDGTILPTEAGPVVKAEMVQRLHRCKRRALRRQSMHSCEPCSTRDSRCFRRRKRSTRPTTCGRTRQAGLTFGRRNPQLAHFGLKPEQGAPAAHPRSSSSCAPSRSGRRVGCATPADDGKRPPCAIGERWM